MKEGDIVEWRGVNKVHRGILVKRNGKALCELDNGKVLPLNALRNSKSAKLIEK